MHDGWDLLQKRLDQAPAAVLPLQYGVTLVMCLALLPLQSARVEWTLGLALSLASMGIVISVVATLLLYRLIREANLVNVTSLFYLVPAARRCWTGSCSPIGWRGSRSWHGGDLAGLLLVFRPAR